MPGMMGGHDEKEQTLNQLLAELDGFDPAAGIVLVGATNRPEILDPALLRAGRFDRQVLVDRPDRVGRAQILAVHTRKVTLGPDVKLEEVAALTPGFTGADLANLVNEAALVATRRGADERLDGGLHRRHRADRRRASRRRTGCSTRASARSWRTTRWATRSSRWRCPGCDPVHKISIIPRGIGALGYTIQRPTEDRYLMTREELEDKMAVLLGGRAAEQLVFGHLSTGAADDLAKATDIARSMVTRYGMGGELGPVAVRDRAERLPRPAAGTRRLYSEETAREIDVAVRELVEARVPARARDPRGEPRAPRGERARAARARRRSPATSSPRCSGGSRQSTARRGRHAALTLDARSRSGPPGAASRRVRGGAACGDPTARARPRHRTMLPSGPRVLGDLWTAGGRDARSARRGARSRAGHAVLHKRDVRAALGWVAFIWLAPIVGGAAYAVFGVNRIRRRAHALGLPELRARAQQERAAPPPPLAPAAAHLEGLHSLADTVVRRPLVAGNAVELLPGGAVAYPAMIAAIDAAQRSVTFCTYIFDPGVAGDAFADALARARERGVTVRVLVDAVGARYRWPPVHRRLRRARRSAPSCSCSGSRPAWLPFVNLRNHRKVLVVDGRVGFTGGHERARRLPPAAGRRPAVHGPAGEGRGAGRRAPPDRVRGGLALHHGRDARGRRVLPAAPPRRPGGGPRRRRRSGRGLRDHPLAAPRRARHRAAARADRDARTSCPTRGSSPRSTSRRCAASRWTSSSRSAGTCRSCSGRRPRSSGRCSSAAAGCGLTPPPFDHTKLMVVDSAWTLLGSANWDPRSLRLNFELDVECYDPELAARAEALAEARIARAHEVTLADVDARALPVKLRDGAARLLSPYL